MSCSNGIGGVTTKVPDDFVCQARVGGDTCDQFRVRRLAGRWRVTLRRRGVDCVLPA